MRRIIRHRVVESIAHARPQLEHYIARRLQYLEAFPYVLADQAVSIRETLKLRIAPALRADYPPVDIEATLRASLAARVENIPDALRRVFDVDVELSARGTVRGDGTYDITPRSAKLKAWWRGL